MKFTTVFALAAAFTTVSAFRVEMFRERGCNAIQHTENFNDCGKCISPPGNFGAVRFSDIAGNRKVIVYNQKGCGNSAQVGQGYGPACWNQGNTSLRSAWVSCETSKRDGDEEVDPAEGRGSDTTPADVATIALFSKDG